MQRGRLGVAADLKEAHAEQANLSRQRFDDQCPGCRLALVDAQTGKVLPDDSPQMQCVFSVWAGTTREAREAFHRFTCLNSTAKSDMQIVADLSTRIQKALASMPPEML